MNMIDNSFSFKEVSVGGLSSVKNAIKSPKHYNLKVKGNEIEVMDIIKEAVKGYDGLNAFYVGNIIKYILRANKKNGLEDFEKAKEYLDRYIKDNKKVAVK